MRKMWTVKIGVSTAEKLDADEWRRQVVISVVEIQDQHITFFHQLLRWIIQMIKQVPMHLITFTCM